MILEHKRIDLFGTMLFEKAIVAPPHTLSNPMPDEACFLYIMEGAYQSLSEDGTLHLKSEESVLMKCGRYLGKAQGSKPDNRYRAVAVHFYPDVLRVVYKNELPGFLKPSPGRRDLPMQHKINSDVLIQKYIESILFYFDNPHLANEEILILKLKEIILLLSQTRNAPKIKTILANLFNPVTYSFREVIEAHVLSSISVPQLAALTHMSVSTFKREFKRVYNASPAAYLLERRLSKAAELLVLSEQRLSDIAFDCGFNNLSHFSKAFKQQFGVPPSAYKDQHVHMSNSRPPLKESGVQ